MSGLRLDELRLEPWGCFEDLQVPFGNAGAVDLVLGPNAAGKSTMTRGITGLLFGIGQRTRDNHTFDYADLRIGAKVTIDESQTDLVRRKGRTGTLSAADASALPDEFFDAALTGLSREIFESLLLIDNEALKEGGAELLQGKGQVGASLFAAAAGIATLHDTIKGLEDAASALFNPRGRTDAIHKAIRQLKEAEKRLRDATFRPQKHRQMEREVQALRQESEELSQKIQGLRVERAALDRRRRVAPLLRRHGELTERLQELAGTPDLPASAREDRTSAESDLRAAEEAVSRARRKRDDLTTEINAHEVDENLLSRASEIQALVNGSDSVAKGAGDRPRLVREAQAAEEKAAGAAKEAGVAVDDLEQLRRASGAQDELDQAVIDHGPLVERRRAALAAEEKAEAASREAAADLEATPDVADPTKLSAAVDAARRLGPIEPSLSETQAEVARLNESAELGLSLMSPRPASLEILKKMAVPSRVAVVARISAREKLEQAKREIGKAEEHLAARARELDARQGELDSHGVVPGPEVLAEARSSREDSWRGLRESLDTGAMPTSTQMEDHETKVAAVDSIVDQQLHGTAELERIASVDRDRRALAREQADIAERLRELDEARSVEDGAWLGLWATVEIDAPAPDVATDWLDQREHVLATLGSRSAEESKAKATAELMEVQRQTLEDGLRDFGVDAKGIPFGALLGIAEAKAEEIGSARRAREGAKDAATKAARGVAAAKAATEKADAALDEWTAAWPETLESVGLPASTTPPAATRISRAVDEGLEQISRQRDLERRIAGIDRDRSEYAEKVRALVAELAPDLADREPARAAFLLGARLDDCKETAAAKAALLGRRPSLDEEVEAAEDAVVVAKERIASVLAAAGCSKSADLPAIEERSAQARELRKDLRGLEDQVVELGDGRFDELCARVADLDPADADVHLQEIERTIEQLSENRDLQNQEVGAREAELRTAELDTAAVEAREEIELIKGEIRILVKDYAMAELGSIVVRRAMDRYRLMHENPLLVRANELFSRITLGHFVELMVDHDEYDGAILVGRQRDGKLKRVGEMSSGTREQLFLALRIAAIERYVTTTAPVPVVFDDAFLESDDDRSEKIFESLAELAASTQVIVLTHRRQQAALGQRILGEGISVIELEGVAPPQLRAAA